MTPYMKAMQGNIGGPMIETALDMARQGVVDAEAGKTQIEAGIIKLNESTALINSIPMIPDTIKNSLLAQNNAVLAVLNDLKTVTEASLNETKAALQLVPTATVPNPQAATALIKAYISALKKKVEMTSKLDTLKALMQQYGQPAPPDVVINIPDQLNLGKDNLGNDIIINKDTVPETVAQRIKDVPKVVIQ